MAGSTFGKLFSVTSWGESHGKGIGVVVDGCPAGLTLDKSIIQTYLDRRKPGQTRYSTPRKENDSVEILSGVFEHQTTGTPLSMLVRNETQQSRDYSEIASYYRPGHADYTFDCKYGFRDYRGGGRSSGRETIARVAAGAIATSLLKELGIQVQAYTRAIGPIEITQSNLDYTEIFKSPFYMPDATASTKAADYLNDKMEAQDSLGGIVECVVSGFPAGIGSPVFDKLDAELAKAVMSIGAVKGFEIGDGFAVATNIGSQNNDAFFADEDGCIHKKSNHAGGILGGISDGSDIILRAAIKPTPSISQPQDTINQNGENISIQIKGRHDPIIVPRAVVVVESMVSITLVDALLCSAVSRIDTLKKLF